MTSMMPALSNLQIFLVVGLPLLLLSFHVNGAPSRKESGSSHKSSDQDEPSSPSSSSSSSSSSSYRLLIDSEFKPLRNSFRLLNNDSISPWTYKFEKDDNLWPPSIAEASCLLTGCLIKGKEVQDYQSKPIFTQILVLRRVAEGKHRYAFQLEYKTISVGCTCVSAHVVHL